MRARERSDFYGEYGRKSSETKVDAILASTVPAVRQSFPESKMGRRLNEKARKVLTYINVHAMIPGRPLWKSLKSQCFPKRGLNSMPM